MFADVIPGTATAWTNFIKVLDTPEAAARKLLSVISQGDGRWGLGTTTIDKSKHKEVAALINSRKRVIAETTNLRPETIPFLEGRESGRYYYIFPRTQPTHEVIDGDYEIIIRLCLLAGLLNQTHFGASDLKAESSGPFIYVGARTFTTRRGDIGVEAYQLRLDIRHGELQPTLSAKVMKVMPGEMMSGAVGIDADSRGFVLSTVAPDRLKKWDGRKSKLIDITFDKAKIRGSRLFLLNRIVEVFCGLLDEAGVNYQRTQFSPTQTVQMPKVTLDRVGQAKHRLLVVNNTGASLDNSVRRRIVEALQHDGVAFPSIEFFADGDPVSNTEWAAQLGAKTACLVLNLKDEDTGSIRIEGQVCDRPWEAYHALAEDILGEEHVDPYTWVKYDCLYRRKESYPVIQGLDCLVEAGEVFIPDAPAKQHPAIRRCAVELAIKSHFAQGVIPIEHGGITGEFTLIHTDRVLLQLGSLKRERLSMAAVVKIRVDDGAISILRRNFYPNMGLDEIEDLSAQYPCLNKAIRSDEFFVVDEANGVFLKRIGGAIVPKIILNSRYPNIESALTEMELNGGVSVAGSYSRGVDWALLPYYITPGKAAGRQWRDTSYIEDRGLFLRYFVPSLLPADRTMGFSNLNDLMVYNMLKRTSDGRSFSSVESDLLDQDVVKLYLSTLTCGVMRLGETSKASLLEKLARLGGMDT
jgi:hypothetical protein